MVDGGGGVRVEGEAELTGQPEPPEKAKGVLLQPPVRLPHTADQPGLQILPAAEPVDQALRPPGHGVDGEVPAGRSSVRSPVNSTWSGCRGSE